MNSKTTKAEAKLAPKKPTPKADEADRAAKLHIHRHNAPPDVRAAYDLIAEYERRCP